ncbi:MAG: hypothetical protein GX258_03090 [Clostridiales bacterium]|nr:hypothetical protein [Clostridiales bacterium]
MTNKENKGSYIPLGIALGIAFWVALDNIGLGLTLGICIGKNKLLTILEYQHRQ